MVVYRLSRFHLAKEKMKIGIADHISSFALWLRIRKKMISYSFSIFYHNRKKRKTKGRYIHGPFWYSNPQPTCFYVKIIYEFLECLKTAYYTPAIQRYLKVIIQLTYISAVVCHVTNILYHRDIVEWSSHATLLTGHLYTVRIAKCSVYGERFNGTKCIIRALQRNKNQLKHDYQISLTYSQITTLNIYSNTLRYDMLSEQNLYD